ncbi:MAG: Zn-dependent hydrolase [Magnetococcales bacterium]|nr:Zn-dependent hydrolase [Magnetococcales bacterium]
MSDNITLTKTIFKNFFPCFIPLKKLVFSISLSLILFISLFSIGSAAQNSEPIYGEVNKQLEKFVVVKLKADLSKLSEKQGQMLANLEDAAMIMDDIFWQQAYGNRDKLFTKWPSKSIQKLLKIHYGPWDRYSGDKPFFVGGGNKPSGANFYPADMAKSELEITGQKNPKLLDPYTMVRRNANGKLIPIAYHQFFANEHKLAAKKLRQAAQLAEDPGFKHYLNMRAEALLNDEYQASDFAWMAMKNNMVDIIIGPIEIYEDKFGYKAAHEAFVLLKDLTWSKKLEKYTKLLPSWQKQLPVGQAYKQDSPGAESDLGVYDVIRYSGDAAATRAIAVHLPNDAQVQLKAGSRRLQLKNAMEAKFNYIVKPMAKLLIAPSQLKHVNLQAFFNNTMYHEIAHGLGVKKLLVSKKSVESSLKENSWMVEEGKADALGLFITAKLQQKEGWHEAKLLDSLVTSFTSIFRAIRFGATSSHARANLIRFNYYKEHNVFIRSPQGLYLIDPQRMNSATSSLIALILRLQGDGDYAGVIELEKKYGTISPQLAKDLKRLQSAGIPLDVVFE